MTIDDVRKQIESRADPTIDIDAANTLKHKKDISLNILECLKLLGGIAAQGASVVFQPASVVFNAMSILLEAPKKIRDFHEAIDEVFAVVAPSLSQFRIYERIEQFRKIDTDLTRATHITMISLVDICALVITLEDPNSKWSKFKSNVKKALLDDDSGLSIELRKFRQAIHGQQSIEATLTLEVALESRHEVSIILAKVFETGKWTEEIASKITTLQQAETKRAQDTTKKAYLVENSRSWLDDEEAYTSWADADDAGARPLLLLLGEKNTGRSTTVSTIVQKLKARYKTSTERASRVFLAWYFFPSLSDKADKGDPTPARTALKHIALQLAEQDMALAKSIASICEEKDNGTYFTDVSCESLWKDLRLGQPRGDTTYYFIFDGVEKLSKMHADAGTQFFGVIKEASHSPTAESDRNGIRLLVSGSGDAVKSLGGFESPTINIAKSNGSDIKSYIKRAMRKYDIFQGNDSKDEASRQKINDKLIEMAGGSFFKVQSALDRIKDLVDSGGQESELDDLLTESDWGREAISKNVVAELQEQLSPQNIDEINELLIWVVYGFEWLSVDQLEAALFLRFGSTPLQKLAKKLQGKYSRLFEVDGQVITVRRDLLSLVIKDPKQLRSVDDDTPRITATITITKGDITTVQNFLWTLFQKSVVEKFEFEPLAGQVTQTRGEIRVNDYDAHLAIVMQAISFLIKKPDDRTENLGRYIVWNLPKHLKELKNPERDHKVDNAAKKDIGSMLFDILGQGTIIRRHWKHFVDVPLFGDTAQISTLLAWLQDPDVTGHFGIYQMDWLDKVISSPSPQRALLFSIAREVGHRWLKSREHDPCEAYRSLIQYLSLEVSEGESNASDESLVILSTDEETLLLDKAERWCKCILRVTEEQSLWYERVGETARKVDEFDYAIAMFFKATKMPGVSWTCYKGLAQSYYQAGKLKDACASQKKALETLSDAKELYPDETWALDMDLGKWYFELKEPDQATVYYEKALEARQADETYYRVLEANLTSQSNDRTLDLVESMSHQTSTDDGISRLGSALLLMATEEDTYERYFTSLLSLTAARDGMLGMVLKAMDEAIQLAADRELLFERSALRLYKGLAIYYYGHEADENRLTSAVRLWEECHSDARKVIEETGTYVQWKWMWLGGQVISGIVRHYFKEATAANTEASAFGKLGEITIGYRISYDDNRVSPAESYMGAYEVLQGNLTAARAHFRKNMLTAHEMLSDDTEENDADAFFVLFQCLLHTGDDVNALIAFELTGPIEKTVEMRLGDIRGEDKVAATELLEFVKEKFSSSDSAPTRYMVVLDELQRRMNPEDDKDEKTATTESYQRIYSLLVAKRPASGDGDDPNQLPYEITYSDIVINWRYFCNGNCGGAWDFETDINICKYCWDTPFCQNCLPLLQQGTSKMLACDAGHKWLHVPRWNLRESTGLRDGTVMMGGEIVDGRHVGGQRVKIKEWLSTIWKEWDIE
ncbi:Nacht tpr domain-containing protein [Fusarium phyllophilum]|uniref:Nacht tpr domain-containing protein n=1 Tax=Fusarium phyllophilum TaxID=47803 RepID=A0A8H5JNT6_9HYPO|nr:Nacht tpr domain-containing protein [Fusarium phyllophilum]